MLKIKITILQESLTTQEASDILMKKKKKTSLKLKSFKQIYYPYLKIIYDVKTKVITKNKLSGKVSCLVDLVNGAEALASEMTEQVEIEVEDDKVLKREVDLEEAREKSFIFIKNTLRHKMKILSIPKVEFEFEEVVYKPFWIIECETNHKKKGIQEFFLLMDGVDGKYHVLQP